MYHISRNGIDDAILGSSNFTVHGLGLRSLNNNIELNLEVDSNRDRRDLKAWFEEIWNNLELVEDVKPEVLRYLEQLYVNHPPEFIYFKTLYPVFERFLAAQYFLTDGRDDAFREEIGITSLKGTLAAAQRKFNDWAKPPGERKPSVLLERLSSAFFKLLDELTIARSRKHILKY
jgi:hypothetical protein